MDDKFTTQKEEIIQKAKQLDEEAKSFIKKQEEMTAVVQSDIAVMVKNQLKRKKEDEKLAQNKKLVEKYQTEIKDLEESIDHKTGELETRRRQLESHSKFSDFLSRVVADKQLSEIIAASKTGETGKTDQDQEINWLRDRFINLKKENKKLKERKKTINREMERVREDERVQIQDMTAKMYHKS